MRNLKYAILGLLLQKPMWGYDIMKAFSETLDEFWHAKHSQIYTELRKLLEEGLVRYDIEKSGELLEKKVYTLTEDGRNDFMEWLVEETPLQPVPKDVFRLKLYFSQFLDLASRLDMLRAQKALHAQRLLHLSAKYEQYGGPPTPADGRLGDYMVLEYAVMRERTAIRWLENCIARLSDGEQQPAAGDQKHEHQ